MEQEVCAICLKAKEPTEWKIITFVSRIKVCAKCVEEEEAAMAREVEEDTNLRED